MNLTGSQRTAMTAGATLLASGLATEIHSTLRNNIPRALAATSVVFTGLTLIALVCIRAWVINTRDEKRELAQARKDADDEKMRFFALEASLESEATRMYRDLNAERARIATTLTVERKAMRAEFEERRLEEVQDAFLTGVEMERSGALKPDTPVPANLIQFPKPAPAVEPEQERTREHGFVGP